MLAVSFVVTAFPELTWPQVWRTVTGIALFYAVIYWVCETSKSRQVGRLNALGIGIILICILLSLATPFVVEWQGAKLSIIPPGFFAHLPRLVSDGVNPNVMAGALVVLITIPSAYLLFVSAQKTVPILEQTRWRLVLVTLSAVSLIASLPMLIFTQSRSAYGAVAAALAVLLALRWRMARIALSAACGLGIGFLIANPAIRTALTNSLLSSSTAGELDYRLEIWSRAWYMIQDFAFTGIGMGSFEKVTDLLYPLILSPPGIQHAHNLFLQVAVDLGIPGLIAWLGILGYVCLSAWRAYRYGEGWVRALGAGLLASNVALCVHGLTDAVTWGIVRTAPLVWLLWGLAVAVGNTALNMYKARLTFDAPPQPSSASSVTPPRS